MAEDLYTASYFDGQDAPFWLFCFTRCKLLWWINGLADSISISEECISSENIKYSSSFIRHANGIGEREGSVISPWFPNCAPVILRGPRPVPSGFIDIYFSNAVLLFTCIYIFN